MIRIRFVFSLLILVALWWMGNTHGVVQPQAPAIGAFFSPYTGFWQQAEAVNQPGTTTATITLPGAEGQVLVDERGVPHIFAPSLKDAFYLQGYWHAKDRLWQMDISVRAAGGRLAEVLGERLLERDRLQRRKGMRVAAQRTLEGWATNKEEIEWVNAYEEGINAYIASLSPKDYPLEFKLLGYAPEPWTGLKSALFFKSMAETLCFRSSDVAASNSRQLLGDSAFAHLFPEHNPKQSPIIPAEVEWAFNPVPTKEAGATEEQLSNRYPFEPLEQTSEEIGSNNWALAGERTASGSPILSNDPHLRLTLPSIWYEIQIHTPELNAYGVSLPGNPGIIIGFNEQVAWGMTNVGQDVVDWYQMNWTDEDKQTYELDGKVQSPEWVVDTIYVRGQDEPVIERTPWTVWGPVVHTDPEHSRFDLAMRWIAHDQPSSKPFHEMGSFVRLMKARNYADYRAALNGYDSPAQNFVFAAHDGDIGITVNGRLPIKADQQGRFVQDGSTSSSAWSGFIPREQVPAVRNPERGFVSSANQRSTAPDYPYYYNGGFDDYRGRYINRRLGQLSEASIEDMKQLQLDPYSLKAEESLPIFLTAIEGQPLSDQLGPIVADLQAWDYYYRADAKAPAFFEEWYWRAYRLSFDEMFPEGEEEGPALLRPEDWRFIALLEEEPADPIFDHQSTPAIEQAADIILRAFREVGEEIGPRYLSPAYTWHQERNTSIDHLGNVPGLGSGPINTDGYRLSPNAISSRNGPSWRMIVSLTDEVEAWGVYPGGASGNPGSPYYTDGLDEWIKGEYFPLFFMKNETDERYPIRARWSVQ